MNRNTIPTSFDNAAAIYKTRRAGAHTKPLCYATRLWSDVSPYDGKPSEYGVRHHATSIVVFKREGAIALNTSGWRTVTTKARINAALGDTFWRVGSRRVRDGFRVSRSGRRVAAYRSVWWVFFDGQPVVEFCDHMTVHYFRPVFTTPNSGPKEVSE